MPYVEQVIRPDLDPIVELMAKKGIKADGDLNYILYAYCIRHVKKSYNSIKNYRGELREVADEIKRRVLDPYENEKIEENGDVF